MLKTRSQTMAQAAYRRISARNGGKPSDEYATFAKKFPALIHSCGLAQAVAFAEAKNEKAYLDDLVNVLREAGYTTISSIKALADRSRNASLTEYMRLSRDALAAASWLKRYVEASGES